MYRIVGRLFTTSIKPLADRRHVATMFYRDCFGRCAFEFTKLVIRARIMSAFVDVIPRGHRI